MSDSQTNLCYPVLAPFKFQGFIAKPPAFIQMDADEARQYQEAGVLGDEEMACLAPESEDEGNGHLGESGKDESSDRATDGALDPAAGQSAPASVSGDGEPAKAAQPRAPAKAAAPRKKEPK